MYYGFSVNESDKFKTIFPETRRLAWFQAMGALVIYFFK